MFLRSLLSTLYDIFMIVDIKYLYYNTPTEHCKYVCTPLGMIPEDVILQ